MKNEGYFKFMITLIYWLLLGILAVLILILDKI